MRTPPWRSLAAAALVLGCVAGALTLVAFASDGDEDGRRAPATTLASAWRGLVGAPRPEVALGQRVIVLLKAPSLADRVRRAGGVVTDAQQRRWTTTALASQQQFLAELAAHGIVARPDIQFTRVVNGFSAVADPSVVVLLERSPKVAGVYPVRAAFPAQTGQTSGQLLSPAPAGLAAYRGTGVTVALLDTAVDPATPFLHGRVLPGFDVIDGGAAARYDQKPGGDRLETHGTAMAGIVAGLGRSGMPTGVAPDVSVLPIRVAGWQRDAAGNWSIYGRTDQVMAGIERAVDPNRSGDAHDAARITLIPLSEPFSAFPDSPLSKAVAGAVALDSLVVVPAGNDGPGGPGFGSIGGPGGAPEALTVGAADLRPAAARVQVSIRAGLDVLLQRKLDLLTTAVPEAGATLEVVPVDKPAEVFDRKGRSRVTGRVVLLPAGQAPRRAALRAADAGAAAVLFAGEGLPPGALGVDPKLLVPVLSAPASLGRLVGSSVRDGEAVSLSFGAVGDGSGRRVPAAFSSWGNAFGAHVKPDVVAPGVAVAAALPGADGDGFSRFVSISGTSVSSAIAAGLAARLAHARPSLDAAGLRSALAATARPLRRAPLSAQGTGVVDAARASVAELVADGASVSFGRGSGDGWLGHRTLTLRNVSSRPLLVDVTAGPQSRGIVLRLSPKRLRIRPSESARLRVTARVGVVAKDDVVGGVIRIVPRGSQPLAVPWAVLLARPPRDLIGNVELSERSFSPSDLTPAVLSIRLGTIERERGRDAVQPVRRLDVFLHDEDGKPLGLLARLRDVLPGQYAFGLTGRGPDGSRLSAGRYELRLLAWPAAGGPPARRTVRFAVE
jgi:subtilase family protein